MNAETIYIINTFFLIFSATLIILMAPGFAMLEAGLVRGKNVVSVLTGNVMLYAVTSMVFLLWGYSLMFGGNSLFDGGVKQTQYSIYAIMFFQLAFVSKTVSIISGAVSERIKIWPFMAFALLMAGVIYPVVGSWTWGGGFLKSLNDFAGSTVIHSVGGWAALAAILLLGARKGKYTKDGRVRAMTASNIPFVMLGAMLLWIGWFGFNGGSALMISSHENADLVAKVILNTNTAGLAGALISAVLMQIKYKKLDITMILNGALGGLVAITAAPDVSLWAPIVVGAIGGALVVVAVPLFDKFKIDDPVGALSVHLVCGVWGTIAAAIFKDGVSMVSQLEAIIIIGAFSFSASYAGFYII
ncbi:MAG TPA: ammonium transporter, partial [Campylobacterales bacterium]|nr:ammonium transporter [Campylobacterales bacterium]